MLQIYKTAPIGMALMDLELRYVRVNQMLAGFNGKSVADHIGRTIADVIPDIAPRIESMYQKVIRTKKPVLNIKIHGRTPANPKEDKDWVSSYYPFLDTAGILRGASVIVQDVTKQVRTMRALRRARRGLKNRIINLLTDRELEVFKLIGRGKGTSEMAKTLGLNNKTVETHRGHIQKKLKLKNSVGVVREAILWTEKTKL